MLNPNPILVSIFHDRDLYEFRVRFVPKPTITSITHYWADNNRVDYPTWDELSDELQEKCIKEVRKELNGE